MYLYFLSYGLVIENQNKPVNFLHVTEFVMGFPTNKHIIEFVFDNSALITVIQVSIIVLSLG